MLKKFWRYVYSFWQNSCTWQTDRQTDTAWWHRLPGVALRGKKQQSKTMFSILPSLLHVWQCFFAQKECSLHISFKYLNHTN